MGLCAIAADGAQHQLLFANHQQFRLTERRLAKECNFSSKSLLGCSCRQTEHGIPLLHKALSVSRNQTWCFLLCWVTNIYRSFRLLIICSTGWTEHRIPPHRQCFNVVRHCKTDRLHKIYSFFAWWILSKTIVVQH